MANKPTKNKQNTLLEQSVILITAEAGTGKSYLKNHIHNTLQSKGLKVISLGTSHKSTVDRTVQSILKGGKVLPRTKRVILIDECFLMTKEQFSKVKRLYPKAIFILFGDPLQFKPPVEGEHLLDEYDFHCVLKLNKVYRQNDPALTAFIQSVKDGKINIDIIKKRMISNKLHIPALTVVTGYRKEHTEAFSDLKIKNMKEIYVARRYWENITTDENGHNHRDIDVDMGLDNSALYYKESETETAVNLIGISECNRGTRISPRKDTGEVIRHFIKNPYINLHKLQGETLSDCGILHIGDSDRDIQRQLYIFITRAKQLNQLYFGTAWSSYFEALKNCGPMISSIKENLELSCDQAIELFDKYLSNIFCLNGDDLEAYLEGVEKQMSNVNNDNNKCPSSCPSLGMFLPIYYKHKVPSTNTLDTLNKSNQNKINETNENNDFFGLAIQSKSPYTLPEVELRTMTFAYPKQRTRATTSIIEELDNLPLCYIKDPKHPEYKKEVFIPKNTFDYSTGTMPTDENTTSMKNIMIESDTLTMAQQRDIIKRFKHLIFRTVESGNKSIHFLFRLSEEPINKEHYIQIVKTIGHQVFKGNYDKVASHRVAGLTRAPGKFRCMPGKEPKEQKVDYYGMKNVIITPRYIPEENTTEVTSVSTYLDMTVIEKKRVDSILLKAINDPHKEDGERGLQIIEKSLMLKHKYDYTSPMLKYFVEEMCKGWHCPEKIVRLQKFVTK